MTAVNTIIMSDRAHLYSDSCMYDENGTIHAFICKTYAMPKLKAALSVRGLARIGATISFDIQRDFSTFDAFMEAKDEYIPRWFWAATADMDALGLTVADMYVVGWSEARDKPDGFYFTTATMECAPIMGNAMVAPMPSPEEWEHLTTLPGFDMQFPANFVPKAGGIALMQSQRRMKFPPFGMARSDTEPKFMVGGHILHTEVSKQGVSQQVIHEWNDAVLEDIVPEPLAQAASIHSVEPDNAATMSRQQRRAWERQHGRIAA